MAVNINTVYTTVLYVLNKEQRGYITPAEFNSLASQVQDEIFQSYFPDGNQQNRKNQTNSQNDTEFFNIYKDIAYKLYPFEKELSFTYDATNNGFTYIGSETVYKIGEIISTYTGQPQYDSVTELTSKSDYSKITRSKLTTPSKQYPICYTTNEASQLLIKVSPTPNSLAVNLLTSPVDPIWGFSIGGLGQYIYSSSSSTDFELDVSEQANLIIGILKYCGIIVRDPQIVQAAEQEARQIEINEKS